MARIARLGKKPLFLERSVTRRRCIECGSFHRLTGGHRIVLETARSEGGLAGVCDYGKGGGVVPAAFFV
jgi:hypothetical protein